MHGRQGHLRQPWLIAIAIACALACKKSPALPADAGSDAEATATATVEVKDDQGTTHRLRYARTTEDPSRQGRRVVLSKVPLGCAEKDPPQNLAFVIWNGPPGGYRTLMSEAFWSDATSHASLPLRARVTLGTGTDALLIEGAISAKGTFHPTPCPSLDDAGAEALPESSGSNEDATIVRPDTKLPLEVRSAKAWLDPRSNRINLIGVELLGKDFPSLSLDLLTTHPTTERDLMLTPQPVHVRFRNSSRDAVHEGHGWVRFLSVSTSNGGKFSVELGLVVPNELQAHGVVRGDVAFVPD